MPDAVDTAEQGAGSDSALKPGPEQPENPDEQAVPKKRRRRRSRKPKADTVQADGMTGMVPQGLVLLTSVNFATT